MARATWSGVISFAGVISIPCKLYSAVESKTSDFNLIHAGCGGRVRRPDWCEVCQRFVESYEVAKGYPIAKDQYVVFDKDELDAIKLSSNGSIEILEFIEPNGIDPRYFDTPHFLAPNWESAKKRFVGSKQFSLFEKALRNTGLWALGKVVMREREHLAMIRPYADGVLLLQVLRFGAELRDCGDINTEVKEVSQRELELGIELIKSWRGNGDLTKYRDQYREALAELVEKKLAGETIEARAMPEPGEAVDLVEQLLAGLAQKGGK